MQAFSVCSRISGVISSFSLTPSPKPLPSLNPKWWAISPKYACIVDCISVSWIIWRTVQFPICLKDFVILSLPVLMDEHSTRRTNLSCDLSLHRQTLVALHWAPQDNHTSVTYTGNHSLQLAKRRKQSGKISVTCLLLDFSPDLSHIYIPLYINPNN